MKEGKEGGEAPFGVRLEWMLDELGAPHRKLRDTALGQGKKDMECSLCREAIPAHLTDVIHDCKRGGDQCPMKLRYLALKALEGDESPALKIDIDPSA